jgi:hypothetical protein
VNLASNCALNRHTGFTVYAVFASSQYDIVAFVSALVFDLYAEVRY